jgi:hypothetical protein
MASFKYKPTKIKYLQDIRTLDEMHQDAVTKFSDQHKELPIMRKRLKTLKKDLQDIHNVKNNTRRRHEITLEINNLEKKISQIDNCSDELEYFDRTSDILLRYYDIDGKLDLTRSEQITEAEIASDEDRNEISTTEVPEKIFNSDEDYTLTEKLIRLNELSKKNMKVRKPVKKRRQTVELHTNKSILSFLACEDDTGGPVKDIEVLANNKATLKNEYMTLIDPSNTVDKTKIVAMRTCLKCNVERVFVQSEGIYVCPKCGQFEYLIVDSEIPNHKDSVSEKPKYPYKKINHLIEKLNQYQSKESTIIPQSVYDIIKSELKKQIIQIDEVTPATIKTILKKHRLNNYYEHHQHIFSKITNTPPPILTREIEDKIKLMFKMIQDPYKKHKPDGRSNFLNYAYVLHKIFLILKMPNHAKYFSLLKSREKLRQQDIVWKKICFDLKWPHHPSP